jgi:hypothetical protein
MVSRYREVRETVHTGLVEFHGTPSDPVYAVEYGTPERTVLLVYARAGRPDQVVLRPRTLRTGARYRVTGGGDAARGDDGRIVTAEALAAGVTVEFTASHDADLVVLDLVE